MRSSARLLPSISVACGRTELGAASLFPLGRSSEQDAIRLPRHRCLLRRATRSSSWHERCRPSTAGARRDG
ncbi:Os01g0256000 [Oryza sativa Japonica Group]|uniref:Os01g0256000 protein n=1 Tax=Oryza sativa subsp. japonica TaxID=39947 RepID=A0A0P0V1D5_ORYSJ|nr:Os01g0256000 [Oryza sativa Japonica Group]